MPAREYCVLHPCIAYISALGGIEIHGIEYGINEYIYCVSNAWYGGAAAKRYHRCKVYYTPKGNPYIQLYGQRFSLNDALRT